VARRAVGTEPPVPMNATERSIRRRLKTEASRGRAWPPVSMDTRTFTFEYVFHLEKARSSTSNLRYMPRRSTNSVPAVICSLLATLILAAPAFGQTSTAPDWRTEPVQPKLDKSTVQRVDQLVAAGVRRGLRPHVFMKVGDSNSWFPTFLQGAGCGPWDLSGHPTLNDTVRWYRGGRLASSMTDLPCAVGNSFTRDSAATKSCENSAWPLSNLPTPLAGSLCNTPPPVECEERGTPIGCEARLLKPRLALVMIGTNDAGQAVAPSRFEGNLDAIVSALVSRSIVPVLSTLPPRIDTQGSSDRVLSLNARIARVARARHLPLLNLWRALTRRETVDQGLFPDGIHLNVFGGWGIGYWAGQSMDLSAEGLKYGANLRNLLTLQLLDRLRQRTSL